VILDTVTRDDDLWIFEALLMHIIAKLGFLFFDIPQYVWGRSAVNDACAQKQTNQWVLM